MAAFKVKNCLLVAWIIPVLLLALATFAGTIVLAIIGIGKASEFNPCSTVNATRCIPVTEIRAAVGAEAPPSQTDEPNSREFLYWLAGATGCGVLFAIIATLAFWALEDVVRRIKKVPIKEELEMEMEPKGDSVDAAPSPTSSSPPPEALDKIEGDEVIKKTSCGILRKLTFGSLVVLFFSFLCAILALLCLLWGIAIAMNHFRQQQVSITNFIIVELLVALGLPILLFTSAILMANVLDFVTFGAVDFRKALPRFLHSVQFKKGEKSDYWVIEDTFYFSLSKRSPEDRIDHGVCFSCYPNLATWILVAIVGLSLNLAVSYFFNITLDMQISVNSCNDPRIDTTFSCFNSSTLVYVDCVQNTNVVLIHCFKFHRFGVDVDLIQSLATTYAFYLVTVSIFGKLFLVMKVFLHLSKRRIWGVFMVLFGSLLLLLSMALIVVWLSGYISAALGELSRLNVISLAQFVMVSLFVVLVGMLMTGGTWAEMKAKKAKKEQ